MSDSSASVNQRSQALQLPQISQTSYENREIDLVPILIAQQLVLLPLYFFIPLWIALLNSLVVITIYLTRVKKRIMIATWIKVIVTFLALAGVLFSFHKLSGKDAGVSLIAIMYGLKIIEIKTRRDVYVLLLLGFFLLLAGFLFNQSPLIAFYQLIPVAAILNALISIHSLSNENSILQGSMKTTLGTLSKYLILALPLMVILFVFFPRLSGPIWRMPGGAGSTSGVSDMMSPGLFSGLRLDDTVAFRVKFSKDVPDGFNLYWRTLTLDYFDGLTWTRSGSGNVLLPPEAVSQVTASQTGELRSQSNDVIYQYELSLEPTKQRWLTFLDRPITLPKRARLFNDYSVKVNHRILDRSKYRASSNPRFQLDKELSQEDRVRYTQLPKDGNPLSREWALSIRNKSSNDKQFIQTILSQINQQPYFYTLSPPIMDRDTVDSFWMDYREGFCEHYAGSLVYLARAANIPARVVLGYQGAEKNPLSDYWIVRNSNAHAWTEIWFEDEGWRRIDPTAAIAPDRIEEQLRQDYTQRESLFADFGFDAVNLDDISFMKKVQFWMDRANSGWNDWIVDYNKESQRKLFDGLGLKRLDVKQVSLLMIALLALFMFVISLKWIKNKPNFQPIQKGFYLLLKKLSKHGVIIEDSQSVYQIIVQMQLEITSKNKGNNQIYSSIEKTSLHKIVKLLKSYLKLRYQENSSSQKDEKDFHKQVKALKIKGL